MRMQRYVAILLAVWPVLASASDPHPTRLPNASALDAQVARALAATHANGIALAVIDQGRIVQVRAYGKRNAAGEALQPDTVMEAASLTQMAFAYMVMQLAEDGVLDLDRPIADYLDKPRSGDPADPGYGPWADLAGDPRWRTLTARMLLTHSAGFANVASVEADGKPRIHVAPGSRDAHSGEGMMLLQFVLERGLGLDVGQEMQRRVFDRFGMQRTSMRWRPDVAANPADGATADGGAAPHERRDTVRAAGSMDTTIADMARFAAGYLAGKGLSPRSASMLTAPQPAIVTAAQFPTLQDELPPERRRADLAAGLGVVTFRGSQGAAFLKDGRDDSTGNLLVCARRYQRCVVILSNDVRAERAFPALVDFAMGKTGAPWTWEYGDMRFVR